MYEAITEGEILRKKPLRTGFLRKIKNALDYFYTNVGETEGVVNGSFEIDADGDGVPDRWELNLFPGGSAAFYTTAPAHGAQSWSCTHPGGAGNGGASLTSDYIPCSTNLNYVLSVVLWATATGMKNKVQLQYYTKAKVANGSPVDLYNSTANPTSATQKLFGFKPPASSAYYKIILVGGHTDTNVAGTAYFDDVQIRGTFLNAAANTGASTQVASLPTSRATGGSSATSSGKTCKILRSGTYAITYVATESPAYGRSTTSQIFKNGSAFGTGNAGDGTFTEVLTLAANDILTFWGWSGSPYDSINYISLVTVNILNNDAYVTDVTD
jgi:hypothetical protein